MMSFETDAVLEKGTALTMLMDKDILHLRTERIPENKGREVGGNPIFLNGDRVETTSEMKTLGHRQIVDTREKYSLCIYQTNIWFTRRMRAREQPLLWLRHLQKVKSEEI